MGKHKVYSYIDSLGYDSTITNEYKIIYDESQMMSHANGYMLKSNTGAFGDYQSNTRLIEIVIIKLLEHILAKIDAMLLEEPNEKLKKLRYDVNKAIKDFRFEAAFKYQIDVQYTDYKIHKA